MPKFDNKTLNEISELSKIMEKYTLYIKKYFRFSSEPYISGDTFRKFSDFVFDEDKSFNPEKVLTNNFVFVKTDLIQSYFNEIHPNQARQQRR